MIITIISLKSAIDDMYIALKASNDKMEIGIIVIIIINITVITIIIRKSKSSSCARDIYKDDAATGEGD